MLFPLGEMKSKFLNPFSIKWISTQIDAIRDPSDENLCQFTTTYMVALFIGKGKADIDSLQFLEYL